MTLRRRTRAPATAGAVVLASLLAGCATPPMTSALQAQRPGTHALRVEQAHVPFFPQDEYQCGPAALAMVLAATGANVAVDALVQQVYLPARAGSLQAEMLATARRHGRLAIVLPPDLEAVLAEVAAGRPVIVLQNLSLPLLPRWHYAVVVGFDLVEGDVVLRSGNTSRLVLPLPVFERTWARSGHWAMVVTAPGTLPSSPDHASLLAAAAALERVDARAAGPTYEALTERDPGLYGAWFGLGNVRLAAGDTAGAQRAFERATQVDPTAADAWNNLAVAQLAAGRLQEARGAAERAVSLGGPRIARYRETLGLVKHAAGS